MNITSLTPERFVVLDRDGTIIQYKPYLNDPDEVTLIPEAAAGLRRLCELNVGLVVVTNQSAVARGLLTWSRLDAIHTRMVERLRDEGVWLHGIYYCPHLPSDLCWCRKPETGLLERAAQDWNFVPRHAFVVGDNACDIAMGRRVGATTLLVRTGLGAQTEAAGQTPAHYTADHLGAATEIIETLILAETQTERDFLRRAA